MKIEELISKYHQNFPLQKLSYKNVNIVIYKLIYTMKQSCSPDKVIIKESLLCMINRSYINSNLSRDEADELIDLVNKEFDDIYDNSCFFCCYILI